MSPRRILVLTVILFLLFLGLYTWNQRTGLWDTLAENTGLEVSGTVMKAVLGTRDSVVGLWDRYLALLDVREENDLLREKVRELEADRMAAMEDRAELARLRALLGLPIPEQWSALGTRVLAWRMGPNAALDALMLGRGYLSGATPGTPVATGEGLVGRVLKAGPSTSVALLITDPGSRVAVVSSEGRVHAILAGAGPSRPLELRFVSLNMKVDSGEILFTSGLDSVFPKGIPVARVNTVAPSGYSSFQYIQADPVIDMTRLEEVLLLERPAGWTPSLPPPVYERQPAPINDPPPAEPTGEPAQP